MQAYKGLYEDQLQTQHASAESYRSLTRGYSRLSADNKALRRETAAVAAAAGDAAGNTAALIASSSADMQQTSSVTSSSIQYATAAVSSSRNGAARSGKEKRDNTGGNHSGGSGVGAVEPPESNPIAATAASASAAVAMRSAGTAAARVSDGDSCVSVTARHAYAATAAESAAAVATAAVAVAAAAGALAEAASTTSSTDDENPAPLLSPSLMTKEEEGVVTSAQECTNRDLGGQGCVVVGNKNSSRHQGSGSYRPTEADCPSTAETVACSPYSDNAEGRCSSTTTGDSATLAMAQHSGDAAVDDTAGTTSLTGGRAPLADCCLPRKMATSRSGGAFADGDQDGRSCIANRGGGANDYAFPQTAGEDQNSPTEDFTSSTAAPRKKQDDPTQNSRDSGMVKSDEGCFIVKGSSTSDKRFPIREGGTGLSRLMKAAPPVEPAPRWRGRSGGPGRSLTSSVSRAEGIDVDAPKRSTSPTPPRRGRWGDCVGGGTWGGDGDAHGHECSRIEPSSRARPHSI